MTFASILQLSDFHFVEELTREGRNNRLVKKVKASPHDFGKLMNLAHCVEDIQWTRGEDFDLAVVTGDLVTDGSRAALATCLEFIEKREIRDGDASRVVTRALGFGAQRRIMLPGNHDRFTRSFAGVQVPGAKFATFERALNISTDYPYAIGYRRPGVDNNPDQPAILFFVFDSTPSGFAKLKFWQRTAVGRVERSDCRTALAQARDIFRDRTVKGLDGTELKVRYSNCVRVGLLHHHPFDENPYTLMENSRLFIEYCRQVGLHLVLFGHDHKEFWETGKGSAGLTGDQNETWFFCCPSASECNSDAGFFTFDFDETGILFGFYKGLDDGSFELGHLDDRSRFVAGSYAKLDFVTPLY